MNKQLIPTLAILVSASSALATLNITLPGISNEQTWTDMTSENHAGYPSFGNPTGNWPSPIAADSGTATFDKVDGTSGFPAGASIYNFIGSGSYTLSESSPLADLQTIVFQTDTILDTPFTSAPSLSFNGGSQNLIADFTATTVGEFNSDGQSTIFLYQWDLTDILGTITDFEINYTSAPHSSNFAMQLNQGDTFVQVVPEPRTYALMAGLACGALILMRRQRR